MKTVSIVCAAALALFAAAGCKKPGGDCGKAITHSMELAKADMAKMGVDDPMMAKMRDLGIRHCSDDKWSDDAIRCMTDAASEAAAQACYGKLTPDQRDKMNKAAMELTPPAGAGSASRAPAGSAGRAE